MRHVLLILGSFVLSHSALGCGGSIAAVGEPERIADAPPEKKPTKATASSAAEESEPVPTCSSVPTPVTGTASCDVAREHLEVEAVALEWDDANAAGHAGSMATLTIRYRNTAANSEIHYPSVSLFSSDARVKTSTEEHGDPFVHPDLYMIAECSTQVGGLQRVHVVDDVPSGTRIDLRVEPAVATGNGIGSCDDTLKKSRYTFVIP